MSTISSVAVRLTAKTASFERAFQRAAMITRSFRHSVGSLLSPLTGLVGRLLALAGIGGIGYMIKRQMQLMDQTAKFADVIGLTTQQLSALQFAAQITGVGLEQLNTGLTRFAKNVGDAINGLMTPLREFRKLHLDPKQLRLMTTWEQLKAVADQFNKLQTNTDRAGVELNLFGRAGIVMGKLLATGSKGLEAFLRRTKELGFAFTRKEFARVEAANDAITRIQFKIGGLKRTLVIQLARYIMAAADWFERLGGSGAQMADRVRHAFHVVTRAIARAADYMQLLKAVWYGFEAAVNLAGETTSRFISLAIKGFREVGKVMSYVAAGPLALIPAVAHRIDSFWGSMGDNIVQTAQESADKFGAAFFKSFQKASDAMEAFVSRKYSAQVLAQFKKIEEGAEAYAKKSLLLTKMPDEQPAHRETFARAIDIRHVVIGWERGRGANQSVHDDQLAQTNKLLAEMNQKLGRGAALVGP